MLDWLWYWHNLVLVNFTNCSRYFKIPKRTVSQFQRFNSVKVYCLANAVFLTKLNTAALSACYWSYWHNSVVESKPKRNMVVNSVVLVVPLPCSCVQLTILQWAACLQPLWTKDSSASAAITIPRVLSQKTAKYAFLSNDLPQLFPATVSFWCEFSPHTAARSQDFCLQVWEACKEETRYECSQFYYERKVGGGWEVRSDQNECKHFPTYWLYLWLWKKTICYFKTKGGLGPRAVCSYCKNNPIWS